MGGEVHFTPDDVMGWIQKEVSLEAGAVERCLAIEVVLLLWLVCTLLFVLEKLLTGKQLSLEDQTFRRETVSIFNIK